MALSTAGKNAIKILLKEKIEKGLIYRDLRFSAAKKLLMATDIKMPFFVDDLN